MNWLSVRAHHHLLSHLLSNVVLTLLLILKLGNFHCILALLLNLSTNFLLIFSVFSRLLSLNPVFFLFELAFTNFLALLLLQVTYQALTRYVLTFEAFPDTIRHAIKVTTEEMIGLFTATTIDEITRILALKAIVRVLHKTIQLDIKVCANH